MENGRTYRRIYENRSWFFVTGDAYDLDFLARQLDETGFRYDFSRRRDVYGEMPGITVYAKPSKIPGIAGIIYDGIGMGRKYRIFNADINPVLRFMAVHGLSFFETASPYEGDPDLKTVFFDCEDGICTIGGKKATDSDIENELKTSDIIVYSNAYNFFMKIRELGIPSRYYGGKSFTSYGQIHYRDPYVDIYGKIAINSSSFIYRESGISGLIELSRMSRIPPLQASIITPGTAVSSMEIADALAEGILVPSKKDDNEDEKGIQELIENDRGGLVLQPRPGIYEDVYEIDFSSMYPSIIVRYGLSIGNDHFLSRSLSKLLEKRLLYKAMDDINEIYHNRNKALKWMLLTSFGYTGYRNAKFGKIEIHEKITGTGRKILAEAIRIAHENGFEVLHGIVDSLWIKGDGDINMVLSEIKAETGIDIVVSGHYRWIVFLPEHDGTGSPSRYFGLGYDGKYKVRGIDLRRNDVPAISRKFQMDALKILESCKNEYDIYQKYRDIKDLESWYIRNIRNFPAEYFSINLKISRYPEYYSVDTIGKHVTGKCMENGNVYPGKEVSYVVSDYKRKIIGLGRDSNVDYNFYRRYLARAFEPFDFIYRNMIKKVRLEDFQLSV